MPTHDEWIGAIMQAVHAATAGDNQPLHHLASLLMAQEGQEQAQAQAQTTEEVPIEPVGAQAPQEASGMAGWMTPRAEDEAATEEGR